MATAPLITSISTDSGIIGDFITNDTSLVLSGTGVSGERVWIRYYAGDRPVDDIVGAYSSSHHYDTSKWALISGGTWSLDLSDSTAFTSAPFPTITPTAITLVEGANTFFAYGYDGTWAGPSRLVITLDTVAPTFTFTGISIDSGFSAADQITNDTTLQWSGTMSEAGTLLIEHRIIGGPWVTFATALPAPAGPGVLGPTLPLADGTREFRITATDNAGNTALPVIFTVVTDTTPPVPPLLTGITTDTNTPADFITTDTTLTFSGTAEANSFVQVTRVGFGVIASGFADAMGQFVAVAGAALPYAEMTLTLTATDVAGNLSAPSAPQPLVVFPGNLFIAPAGAQYFQTFNGSWGDDTIIAAAPSSHNAAHGAYGDDYIDLNGYLNTITGGAGNDVIRAGQGFASVDAGTGNDWIFADGMLNTILGGDGMDTISGTDGYDHIDAGAGNDAIFAGGSNNTILGGTGDDYIETTSAGYNTIHGGAGINQIYTNGWNNVITGGDEANIIRDADGQVTINVGNGPNSIVLLGWNNNLTMGNGSNLVNVALGGNTTITAGNGNNLIQLAGWNNTITTGAGNDGIFAGMGMSNISSGGGHDQVWVGGSGPSLVNLGAGNDVAYTGGAFGDTLIGGTGDDQFVIVSASTIVIENMGEGTDYAWVGVSGYTMANNVEVAYLTANNIALAGNDGANQMAAFGTGSYLDGRGGDDQLFGTANADVFRGGADNDAFYGMGGADRYIYDTAAWGNDAIGGWVAGQKLDFTGSGLSFAQLSIGSGAGNSLVSFGGSSIFVGGAASLSITDFIFG